MQVFNNRVFFTFFSNRLFVLSFKNDIDRAGYISHYLTTVGIKD